MSVKCKKCERVISEKSKQCPYCGASAKKKTSLLTWMVTIILVFWIIGYVSSQTQRTSANSNQAIVQNESYANPDPSEACGFMDATGMATRGYKNPNGIGYFCSSPYKMLGTGFPLNNSIAYYAEGDAKKVTKLELVLTVSSKQEAKQAHTELANSAEALLKKALNASLPQQAKEAIFAGSNGKWKIGNANVSITRVDWPTGKGYEIELVVE